MKKIFTLFIAMLYLAVSSGLAVEIHHCMGKVEDFSLVKSGAEECGKCGMPKGDNECCKDELKFIKLNDSHKLLDAGFKLDIPCAVVVSTYQPITKSICKRDFQAGFSNHSPPYSFSPSLYIQHCVFRI